MSPSPSHRGMLLVLFWVLLATGCTSVTAPPAQTTAPQGNAATSHELLGDLRTVDPCTLVDPTALQGFGPVENAGTVSLDYCLLHVKAADGSLVQVAIGEMAAAPEQPANPVVQRGPLRIEQDPPLPGHCTRRIRFADSITMQISADLLTGDKPTGLCSIAQTGAEAVADTIAQHRVGHRAFPENSLALVDPCTRLDLGVVHQVPGLEEAQPQPSPAGHQCMWGAQTPDSPRVELLHSAGEPPKVLHGAAVEESIAGRQTVISIVGGDPQVPLCSAETGHIPFGDPATGQVEVALLVVAIPGMTGIDACEFARGLAGQSWPHLPNQGR